jgi:hypothetical protein
VLSQMAVLFWYALLALGALAVFALIVALLRRWPLGVALIAAVHVLMLSEFPSSFPLATIAGVNVVVMDIVSVALFVIFVLNVAHGRSLAVRLMIVFAGLVGISLLFGVTRHGLGAAVNEARQFFWVISCLLWSTTLAWRSLGLRKQVLSLLAVLGWFLSLVAAVHAALRGFGTYGDQFVGASGELVDLRILVSGQALVLFFSLLAAMALARNNKPRWLLGAFVFGATLLLTQQRTVWVVAIVTILCAVLLDRRRRASDFVWVLMGLLAIGVLLSSGLLNALLVDIAGAAQDTRTYDGRNLGWIALVQQAFDSGPGVVMFGEPFGAGYARIEVGRLAIYNPHNWYVNIFLRTGLVGLGVYCAALVVGLVNLLRRRSSLFLLLVVIAVAAYSCTYNAPWYVALLLGGALALGRVVQVPAPEWVQADRNFAAPLMSPGGPSWGNQTVRRGKPGQAGLDQFLGAVGKR